MLASIILDTFKESETTDIATALDELCSPDDNYAFSSACIYAFWNVPEQEILYIGLAKDIARRFRQHTGLVQCETNCCKRDHIAAYFSDKERLGFSIMVQSGLTSPTTKADAEVSAASIGDDPFTADLKDIFGAEKNIAIAEGMLLELHKQLGERLPAWNKIQGSRLGRKQRSLYEYTAHLKGVQGLLIGKSIKKKEKELEEEGTPFELLLNMEGSELSELNAHSTIREIAEDATICEHELLLHGARLLHATQLILFEQALKIQEQENPYAKTRFDSMKDEGYWDKVVTLPGID